MRQKAGALKSRGEAATTGALRRYFHGRPYWIHKDMALNQIVAVTKGELTPGEFDYYTRASVDFVVCRDDHDQGFEIAVEFDGEQHDQPDQRRKDDIKNRVCIAAGLPLLRVGKELVQLRGSLTLLEFMLDQYFGERWIEAEIAAGRVAADEEYFAKFPETVAIQRRLFDRGLLAPTYAFDGLPDVDPSIVHWCRMIGEGISSPWESQVPSGMWKATARVEIIKGTMAPPRVEFSISRTAELREPNPNQNVLGVHGWHLASELAGYLCFSYIEAEWMPR